MMMLTLIPAIPVYAAPAVDPDGFTVVSNYNDLKTVLLDTTTTKVRFGANITLDKGIKISEKKKSLVIDGGNFSLIEKGSLSCTANMYVSLNGALKNITMQNMVIFGQNYYGPLTIHCGVKDVVMTYDNIKYRGPQVTYNPHGTAVYRNSNIELVHAYANCKGEVAEARHVRLEGNVEIVKNAKGNCHEVFWIYNPCVVGGITVAAGANVNVNVVDQYSMSGFVYYSSPGYFYVEDGATFNYTGMDQFQKCGFMNDVRIGKDSKTNIVVKNINNLFQKLMYVNGSMYIGENAEYNMFTYGKRDVKLPVLKFYGAKAKLVVDNPKQVVIYSEATKQVCANYGLSLSACCGSVNFTFKDIKSLEYWNFSTPASKDNLENPSSEWRNATGKYTLNMTVKDGNVTSASAPGYNGSNPLNAKALDFRSIHALRINGQAAPGKINLRHVDMDGNDIVPAETFEVEPGQYGLNNEYAAIGYSADEFLYKGLDAASAPVTGEIASEEEIEIIHVYRRQEKIDISGNITWVGNTDTKPAACEVVLLSDGNVTNSMMVDSNINSFTFAGVNKYRDADNEFVYTVDDLQNYEGFVKTVNGYEITQTFTEYTVTVIYYDRMIDAEITRENFKVLHNGSITVRAKDFPMLFAESPIYKTYDNVQGDIEHTFYYSI